MAKIQKFEVTSHVDEVIRTTEGAIEKAMVEIGLQAEGYAKMYAPVDTGRLRNSINWATSEHEGSGDGRDMPEGNPEKGKVCIGTNVEYAARQELGDFKHQTGQSPYLQPAMQNHVSEYKQILRECLTHAEEATKVSLQ